jgi:hypothetical protein
LELSARDFTPGLVFRGRATERDHLAAGAWVFYGADTHQPQVVLAVEPSPVVPGHHGETELAARAQTCWQNAGHGCTKL